MAYKTRKGVVSISAIRAHIKQKIEYGTFEIAHVEEMCKSLKEKGVKASDIEDLRRSWMAVLELKNTK